MVKKSTPITIERTTIKTIKMVCVRKEWTLSSFYERAIQAQLEKASRGLAQYKPLPETARLHRTSIWITSALIDEITAVHASKRIFLYTAVHEYLKELL